MMWTEDCLGNLKDLSNWKRLKEHGESGKRPDRALSNLNRMNLGCRGNSYCANNTADNASNGASRHRYRLNVRVYRSLLWMKGALHTYDKRKTLMHLS